MGAAANVNVISPHVTLNPSEGSAVLANARCRARSHANISKMRRGVRFSPKTEKENIDWTSRVEGLHISNEYAFQIQRVSLHRCEALYLCEKSLTRQALKVAHETECIGHLYRRQRVLRKNIQTVEQVIYLVRHRFLAKQAMQSLASASAHDHHREIAFLFTRSRFDFVEHRATDSFL